MLIRYFIATITIILLSINLAKADELSLKIAKKMNMGNIEYLYTVDAVKDNEKKGIKFENAVRLVHFSLFKSLAMSAKEINNFQSYIINKIIIKNTRKKGQFELLGFIANNKLHYLSDKNTIVTKLKAALSKNHIKVSGNKVFLK